MNKKIQIGDVFEIQTSKGKVLMQYVWESEDMGSLVKIFKGFYDKTPDDITDILSEEEQYMIFFSVEYALKKNIINYIGHYNIGNFTPPKYMRSMHKVRGKILGWHIVDTDTWKRNLVKDLNSQERKLSPWEWWNDTLLIERLEDGWSLDKWV